MNPARFSAAVLRVLVLVVATFALVASPARAVIAEVTVGPEKTTFGVQPRQPAAFLPAPLQYHGGTIDTASYTYAIYWDPVGEYHNDWMTFIDGYFHDVGAASGQLDNVFSLSGQYTGPNATRASYNSTFRGAYSDTQPYPSNGCVEPKGQPTCLTDAQVRAELKRFITANHLPTGADVIYFVLTPPAVTVCLDEGGKGNCSDSDNELEEEATGEKERVETTTGFCGYHSAVEPSSESPIVYAVQPWIAGHAGHVLNEFPLETRPSTAAELACQNQKVLVEPNQATVFNHFNAYETGLADLIVNSLSIEQGEIVIDPLFNGWYQTGSSAEQGDMCRGIFAPVRSEELEKPSEGTNALKLSNQTINGDAYYLQYAFSSVSVTSGQENVCWSGTELTPHFTATNPVNGGDMVAFDANESGITMRANLTKLALDEPFLPPVYRWDFGDGSPVIDSGFAASVLHAYAYGGNYSVTLTVTDSGGNSANITNRVAVVGPQRPGSSTPPGVSPAGVEPTVAPENGKPISSPTVTEFVESSSLTKALRNGLAIGYSVNEQVAGSVQVLLNATTAKHLGIRGVAAVGLPKGSPRSIVIGSAVLVTTKSGKGTVRIKFSRTVAKRLAHTHTLKVLLRTVARNASRQGPQTVTTLTPITLSK